MNKESKLAKIIESAEYLLCVEENNGEVDRYDICTEILDLYHDSGNVMVYAAHVSFSNDKISIAKSIPFLKMVKFI